MKKAINPTTLKEESVTDKTIVNVVDGVNWLLTEEERLDLENREAAHKLKQADYIAREKYKDDRRKEYGSIEDQLDKMYWDQVNGTSTWKDHIDIIKTKYPKPIEK